jgi:hypothetical protein
MEVIKDTVLNSNGEIKDVAASLRSEIEARLVE